MSEENKTATTATTATTETVAPEPAPQVIDKGNYVLEENKFGGKLEGLSYFVLQFKSDTDEQADASIQTILGNKEVKDTQGNVIVPAVQGKWNSKQVIAIINSATRAAQRVKAQQVILGEEEDKQNVVYAKRLKENPVLLSPEDSEKWAPGERDLSIQGQMRQIAELNKKGDPASMIKAMAMLLDVQKQMQEKFQSDNAEATQAQTNGQ